MSKNTVIGALFVSILILGFNSSAMAQQLDFSELPFTGNSELAQIDIRNLMDGNVNEILEKIREIIPITNINSGGMHGKIGVLIYTHGMGTPGSHEPAKTEPIKNALERLGYPSEIITHMPYTWDEGLQKLDERGVEYVIFLYTDLFGPESTVIHNVTRGIFGSIEAYKHCPGVPMGPDSCLYMGELTKPAAETSDATLVFSRPASPDDRILREIFVKIARNSISESNGTPENEIFVMVGHGARSNLNDLAQVEELTNAAKYVQQKIGYADGFGVTAREDWPDLMPAAIDAAADKIETSLAANNADRVVLVPATGSGSGFDAVKEELDNMGIKYVVTEEPIPIGSKEFVQWAQKNVLGATVYILKERPSENTVTPNWG
jgi:hypothetical protein